MSTKITSPEKDTVENLFWVFAIHYQICLMLKSIPRRGDVVWIHLDPQKGPEQTSVLRVDWTKYPKQASYPYFCF